MEYQQVGRQSRRRRSTSLVLGVCVVILLIIIGVSVAVALSRRNCADSNDSDLRTVIITKCKTYLAAHEEESSDNNCEEIWMAFAGAFVGRDSCDVPVEAYDPLVRAVSEKPACNRMLFWSKTKDIVHQFTESKKCLVTLEDTLLGFVMNDLTWCSKNNSSETFTTGCPGWIECEKNPVRSFWNRASAAFAESACGDVTAMLNGSIATPFNVNSIFASVEVKKFDPSRMRALNVVLVTRGNDTVTCDNSSLQRLREAIDPKLRYSCREVPRSKILDCISDPEKPCGDCW
ncbi:ADP-ribosyl cyclase/cyclic ADP-ribose hydrolase 1-like [Megalops cyprinoides]|uniref:ADP-ribosyl cyclase/cyclic ADP-ribose hydrolase 1-like n=1 Tax=Megalops cyprinoides TaxID=118141 RepID=UPI001863D541|nr:ADP-ribosyl cyclase/cyclic ADP-ribose hydrolase 1-like [Megalops cyprinoides]